MCLIIHKPQGKILPLDWIKNASSRNPDGWGVMSSKDGRLTIAKGVKMSKLPKALDRIGDVDLFVHLRFATHGTKDIDNCHPFVICENRFAVMHNGIFDIDTEANKKRSDTWHYCQSILEPVLKDYVFDQNLCDAIETSIGQHNKLAILCHDGTAMIVGRSFGEEKDGCWLSNSYSIEPDQWEGWRDFRNKKTPNLALRSWSNYCDLEDLAILPDTELEELCMEEPEVVAKAIREYFAWSQIEQDYR